MAPQNSKALFLIHFKLSSPPCPFREVITTQGLLPFPHPKRFKSTLPAGFQPGETCPQLGPLQLIRSASLIPAKLETGATWRRDDSHMCMLRWNRKPRRRWVQDVLKWLHPATSKERQSPRHRELRILFLGANITRTDTKLRPLAHSKVQPRCPRVPSTSLSISFTTVTYQEVRGNIQFWENSK